MQFLFQLKCIVQRYDNHNSYGAMGSTLGSCREGLLLLNLIIEARSRAQNISITCYTNFTILRGKRPSIKYVHTEGEGGMLKSGRGRSKGGCVELLLEIRPNCRQGGRGGPKT